MSSFLRSYIRVVSLLSVLFLSSVSSYASHIFGMDLYYTNIGGNVYTITLAVYGDCSGGSFFNLSTSSPTIEIYNGNTFLNNLSLTVQPPSNGIEVSPVCPAQAGNTTCTNITSTLPGIKKFIYSGNVTLPSTSTVWRFLFNGNMGGTSSAGRSNSITNVNIPGGGSTIQLIDTLNNTIGGNSSAQYNTIPTPYFCVNTPANYNPAAVDPNGDVLSFDLVPAIDAGTGVSVNYVWPYNAAAPLGVSAGTFSFSGSNGQLSFTPNIAQRADVVYNVRELVGGVLKGTSQREMTIVVLSPCSNNPPTGSMSAASGGTIVGATQLNICNNAGLFTFHVNPTDADLDTITMTSSGLPAGATFSVINNSTIAPLGTFQWNASTAAPGTYTFYITYQDRGCPLSSRQSIAYTINILPAPTETVTLISAATCTRKAVFTVTPGTTSSPYIISILQGATTVHNFTGATGTITDSLLPGTYTIRTYNSVSCYKDTTVTFASPPLPSGTFVINPPLCPGALNGFISVTGTLGVSPYQYALGTGSYGTTGTFTGLGSAIYTVHIKDVNGCIKDTSVLLPSPAPILETLNIRRSTCNGYANGRVIVNAYNSVGPYTYAIGAGPYSTNDTFTNLTAGTYTFHVMNGNGCIDDTTITFVDSQYLHASVSVPPILCNGGTTTATITGIGGFGTPYSYAYNTGGFGPFNTFTLGAGSYTLHVTDPQTCFFDTIISLVQPSPVVITTGTVGVGCYGGNTGIITVTATGGTPSYTYAVDAGTYGTSSTIGGLTAGPHTVNVKDANNCVYSSTATITQPTAVSADSVIMQIPLCNGGNNGIATIYASGGTPGYTYAINASTYGASNTFTGLTAGTYTLHIKDDNGCIKDTIVYLANPPGMTPGATVVQSLCQNLSNGQVTLSVSGGTPAYTYAVGAGTYSSSPAFTALAAGTYVFHIKDANGCIKDTSVTVTNTTHITGTFLFTPPLCNGDANGAITVNGGSGISPYTYAFGTGGYGATNVLSSITAGSYIFHIRDVNGCIGDTTVSLTQPTIVYPSVTITPPSCFGYSNGVINVSASGGTPAYTFSLNNNAFVGITTYTGRTAGIDTIRVKDANGCIHDTVFTIGQPTPLVITGIVISNVSCNGGANGMITVAATGGTLAYQYAANAGTYQVSNTLTGLTSGAQVIHVKDTHGCITDSSVTITQPVNLAISGAVVTNPTCEGYTDGVIIIGVGGGTAPYRYSKDNVVFTNSSSFTGLTEGTYTIFITDTNNCTADTTITLIGFPHIFIDSFTATAATCTGKNDGGLIVYASGGNPPLTYSLSGNAPTTPPNIFTSLFAGNHTITITDSRNCTKDSLIVIGQPDTLKVLTNITPNDCVGADDRGGIVAAIQGGTGPFTFLWSVDSNTNSYVTGLPNGVYTVKVKDHNNCQDSATATILYDDCCTPYLPNAFSPNGDGKNDVYRMVYKGDIRIIEFSIYNRYGERVFTTEYDERGWDGTLKGEPCDIGSYFYYIRLLCGNRHNKILEFKGDVTLVK